MSVSCKILIFVFSLSFDNLTTTQTEDYLIVRISSNKDAEVDYNIYEIKVDNEAGRVRIISEYDDYPKASDNPLYGDGGTY